MSQNDNDNDNVNVLHGNDLVFATKFCFGVGHMFNDLCAAIWFSYMLFYLQIILQISPSISGILLMIGMYVSLKKKFKFFNQKSHKFQFKLQK